MANSMYPEMEPGRCKGCGAPALRYKNGIPQELKHLRETDWYHAGGNGECAYVRSPQYVAKRELDEAFISEPDAQVIQYEIRYFDMSPGNTYRRASGIAGYMTLSDEELAKKNADNSSDGHLKRAHIHRMVNGQPEPSPMYIGKQNNS